MVADSASTSGKSHKNSDRGFKSGKNNTTSLSSKNYNEVNSSPWEFDNFLGGGQDITNDPSTEFGQILYSLRAMSTELQVLSALVNRKLRIFYFNHTVLNGLNKTMAKVYLSNL